MRKPIIAGNWKMNKTIAEAVDLARAMRRDLNAIETVESVVCPTFVALPAVADALAGTKIAVGAQNMFWAESGAYTGEIAPNMLAGLCQYVILGHSERRQYFGETDEGVNKKAHAAFKHGLIPIIAVGENLAQNQAGETDQVVRTQVTGALQGLSKEQVASLVIAYEPVWAIGTGLNADPAGAAHVIGVTIRGTVADCTTSPPPRPCASSTAAAPTRPTSPTSWLCPTSTAPWLAERASRPSPSSTWSKPPPACAASSELHRGRRGDTEDTEKTRKADRTETGQRRQKARKPAKVVKYKGCIPAISSVRLAPCASRLPRCPQNLLCELCATSVCSVSARVTPHLLCELCASSVCSVSARITPHLLCELCVSSVLSVSARVTPHLLCELCASSVFSVSAPVAPHLLCELCVSSVFSVSALVTLPSCPPSSPPCSLSHCL